MTQAQGFCKMMILREKREGMKGINSTKRDEEMNKRIMNGMKNFMKATVKIRQQDHAPAELVLRVLNENGIPLTEQKILDDYAEVKDVGTLDEQYADQYEDRFDGTFQDETGFIDIDIFLPLIKNVLRRNCDITETGDSVFIGELEDDLMKKEKLKVIPQKEVEDLIRTYINHSRIHDVHLLDDIDGLYDHNSLLIGFVKGCHKRNRQFNDLMTEFFNCYEDADPEIYPSLYGKIRKQ